MWKFSKFSICWMLDGIFLLQWMSFTEEVLTSNIGPLQTGAGRLVELWMPLMPWQCGVWPGGIWPFKYDLYIPLYTRWSENIYPYDDLNMNICFPLYVFHVHKDLCEYPLSAESESHWWWLTTTQKWWFDHDRNVFEDWNLGLGARNMLPSPKADNGSWVDDTVKKLLLETVGSTW